MQREGKERVRESEREREREGKVSSQEKTNFKNKKNSSPAAFLDLVDHLRRDRWRRRLRGSLLSPGLRVGPHEYEPGFDADRVRPHPAAQGGEGGGFRGRVVLELRDAGAGPLGVELPALDFRVFFFGVVFVSRVSPRKKKKRGKKTKKKRMKKRNSLSLSLSLSYLFLSRTVIRASQHEGIATVVLPLADLDAPLAQRREPVRTSVVPGVPASRNRIPPDDEVAPEDLHRVWPRRVDGHSTEDRVPLLGPVEVGR